jgi:hypothetical protein
MKTVRYPIWIPTSNSIRRNNRVKITLYSFFLALLLQSCNTAYYQHANDMGGQPATLHLRDGRVLNGKVEVRSFDQFSSVRKIRFSEGASGSYLQYAPYQIAGLYFNGAFYSLEAVRAMDMWDNFAYKFLRDITPVAGLLQLFEDEYSEKSAFGDVEKVRKLYLKLPGRDEVYDAQSDRFIPNFDEKVSRYLSDCPLVAQKIRNGERGYTYGFVNHGETQRKQVWMTLAFEYNQCK